MNTPESKPPIGNWLNRITVSVASPSNRVYANGRQQVEIVVVIEPRTGITLTAQEQRSVKLMVRNRDSVPVALPESQEDWLPWFFSRERNAYLEYPGNQRTPAPVTPDQLYTYRFYVSCASTGHGPSLETLYVGITRHLDGALYEYVTDGFESDFNSKVELRTAEIPTYQVPGNYLFERNLVAGDGNSDIYTWQYSLAGAGVQQPVVRFVSANLEPAGMIQWVDRNPSITQASLVGYAPPGTTEFQYNPFIQLGNVFKPVAQARNPRMGHVTLVLQASNNIPYDSPSAINQGGPCELTAVDVYGNDHQLLIRFKDPSPQGRHELVLG